MIKKAIVTSANLVTDQNGQPKIYNGNYGTMYFHSITFDNGDSGEYMSKSKDQNKFIVTQESEYELQPNTNPQYPAKIKPVKENNWSGGGKEDPDRQKRIVAQSSLDRSITYLHNKHTEGENLSYKKEDVLAMADYFFDWVMNK